MSIGIRVALGINQADPVFRRRSRLRLAAFISPVVFLLLWAGVTKLEIFSPQLLVSPWEVLASLHELLGSGELWAHLSVSLSRLGIGFLIGASSGLLFGILMALSRTVEDFFSPLFQALRQVPSIALIPIFILLFGIEELFKIAIVTKAAFFTVALASYEATKGIPKHYFEVAQAYQLPNRSLYAKMVVPAILPPVLTGLRIAFARSWTILVAAELLAADSGLGHMMQMGREIFRIDIVMVGVVLTGLIGFGIDRLFKWGEANLIPWRKVEAK
ncbi:MULTISPECIES: ABC transporter permease [Methylobacillus]|uniref:Binding-protein-dependent transport systems inner membrane component n=1 Tax=Methylobacillus flagellatus (strain ATCC 51484 / DSM 6875 / VKM B-1610 / KT) TaxID=265072 RepID=Q1H112_METFK|nr:MULTISPECIES: ABC transporter permease [Methylobacillus]ABE49825.1 binding-protein-dependent transport systems inner membrane component [Methylobacillus flagellatus KT]MPS48949.1 ABC transporter permease [Methylobacillus sp.]